MTCLHRKLMPLMFVFAIVVGVTTLPADETSTIPKAETRSTQLDSTHSSLPIEQVDKTTLPEAHPAQGSEQWILLISIVALIAFGAGFVHSGIGFGFGIVAIGLMPLVIDARHTHLLVSLCAVPVQIGTVWAYRKGVVWRPLLFALAGAVIGLPLGLWLFNSINLDWLTRGTGIALLLMIAYSFHNRSISRRRAEQTDSENAECDADDQEKSSDAVGASTIGVASGFLMGAVTMPGPPVVAYALQQDWDQEQFKAFVNQFLLALSVFKIFGLFVSTDISQQATIESLLIIPAALLGIAIGKRFSTRLSAGKFRTLVAVGLTFVAVLLIAIGAR